MIDFDGSTELIDCGSPAALDNIWDGGGTLTWWMDLDSYGEGGGFGRICDKNSSPGWLIFFPGAAADGMTFSQEFTTTAGLWRTADSVIALGSTFCCALTYNSDATTNDAQFHISGGSVTTNETVAPVGTRADDSGVELTIAGNVAPSRKTDGRFGDIRIYNRILSPTEIGAIYVTKGADNIVPDIAHWPMREGASGTASTMRDIGPNKISGTPTGTPTWAADNAIRRRGPT